MGEWELVAQLQVGTGRSCDRADTGLRIDGRAVSAMQMNVIDALCNQTAHATKIQRYDSALTP